MSGRKLVLMVFDELILEWKVLCCNLLLLGKQLWVFVLVGAHQHAL